jgi:hypothetical protein
MGCPGAAAKKLVVLTGQQNPGQQHSGHAEPFASADGRERAAPGQRLDLRPA